MDKRLASELFKALGEENRLKIVKILMINDEVCACKFLDMVNCKQATLSHHLSTLSDLNLIASRRDGKRIMYSCNKELVKELMEFLLTPCEGCKIKEND